MTDDIFEKLERIAKDEFGVSIVTADWKIEDVAKYIKEYFQLDKVNEDDD